MSASPAGHTPGRTPNGGAPPIVRRPKKADPLVRPNSKKRGTHLTQPNGATVNHASGSAAALRGPPQKMPHHHGKPRPRDVRPSPPPHALEAGSGIKANGFSDPKESFTDFPLVITKRALMEGLRHHVARFASKQEVDPSNKEEFTRPVRLHRRDPRLAPEGSGGIKEEEDGLPAEERERRDQERAQRKLSEQRTRLS